MKLSVWLVWPAIVLGAALAAAAGVAPDEPRAWVLAQAAMSLERAVQIAETRFKARVVRADTQREGGHVVYRLRMLSPDGRVFSVRIDAQTGNAS
jgi:uncharacterized membrane protein YkoI